METLGSRLSAALARVLRPQPSPAAVEEPSPQPLPLAVERPSPYAPVDEMQDRLTIESTGDPAASLTAAAVALAFRRTLALDTVLPPEILALPGLPGIKTRILINALVGTLPQPRLLQLGALGAGAVAAAMHGQRITVMAVADWRGDAAAEHEWHHAVARHRATAVDVHLVTAAIGDVDLHSIGRSNICCLGEMQPDTGRFVLPLTWLDRDFVVLVERWNDPAVREALAETLARLGVICLHSIGITTRVGDQGALDACQESDWRQGCCILALRQPNATGSP